MQAANSFALGFSLFRGGLRRLSGLRDERRLGRRLGRRFAADQPETVQGQRQQEKRECDPTNHFGYFFPVVAGCEMPCRKCCSSEWLQMSSPMSHGFSLNMRLAVKDCV